MPLHRDFSLHRRLDKLVAKVDKLIGPTVSYELGSAFHFDLFTPDEQIALRAFIEEVDYGCSYAHGVAHVALPVEEEDMLETWIRLDIALLEGDHAIAERCRRYLALSEDDKEAIHQAFLSIDENVLPDVTHCSMAPTMQWDGHNQHIYRGGYRWYRDHIEQPYCQGQYLRRWEIDDMWMWLAAAAQFKTQLA